MESTTRLTTRTARFRFTPRRATRGALGAVTATAVALAALVAIGVNCWDAVMGFQGVCICGALGVAAGVALGRPEPRAARIIGGGIGGVVAAYIALASGEMLSPGTIQWALGGGAYAALFALPVAAFTGGLIGLLDAARRAVRWEIATRGRMRTARRITAARIDDDELVGRPVFGHGTAAGHKPTADSGRRFRNATSAQEGACAEMTGADLSRHFIQRNRRYSLAPGPTERTRRSD
jgi:hypothetical protein